MPKRFKYYFPLYPSAFRSFGEVPCEVAWISSSTFSKCLRLAPTSVSVCYCHNPTRFIYQADEYIEGEVRNKAKNRLARWTLPWLRLADRQAVHRMDIIIANSHAVRQRIRHSYGLEARIIHPPVEVSRFQVSEVSQDYHLIVSRLLAYKRIDRAVEAFNRLGKPLIIVGEGPDRARLESLAGPHIRFAGRLTDPEVAGLLAGCRAFIFPGEEDFGITPVEAQACGKPVVAWARGGALETVKSGETGCFYHEGTPEALAEAVECAERITWDPHRIRRWAEGFSEAHFLNAMDAILEEARTEHRARLNQQRAGKSFRWDGSPAHGEDFSPDTRHHVSVTETDP
jgi:glycosyltransferase involved in cell wall biosynthesis